MKCRVCGYDLDPNRAYCDMCGTKVIAPEEISAPEERPTDSRESRSENPKPILSSQQPGEASAGETEFSWNIYDFPKPKQPEDIPIQWPAYDTVEARTLLDESSEGRIREAMEKKQPVVMVNNDVSEGFIAVPGNEDPAWKEPMAESTKQAEKFFTFQKKNEEFQRLLDEEYEKLKNRKKGEDYHEEQFRMPWDELSAQQAQQIRSFTPSPVVRAEDLSDFEQMLLSNTKDADFVSGATIPINLEKIQAEVQAQEEARLHRSREAFAETHKSANRERLEAMTKAREDYFRSIGIEPDVPKDDREPVSESPEIPDDAATQDLETESEHAEAPEETEAEQVHTPEETESEQTEAPEDPEEAVEKLFAPLEEDLKTQKKKKKKHGFLKFLLFLLLLAGLTETSVIGLRQFLPDHEITKTASRIEQTVNSEAKIQYFRIREYVVEVLEGIGILPGETEPADDPLPEDVEPVLNLGALVTVFNKNIQSITESPKLGYDDTMTYEIEGLGDMDVIEDIETKKAVYACLISFNSKWIDYVNEGEDRSCLDLLKADGAAYRSAVNFPKVGEIRETFDSLALGEIRYNKEQYFTFVREQITVEEEGEAVKRAYSWIYRLEDVAGDIKIVDYTSFE
ncbi:MAG: hypothetical protein PHI61_06870 [Eubacteriales bacterium]|nr:hypothetical protein [Eubacteriales bacterium]